MANKIDLKLPGMDEYFTQEAYKVLRTNIQFCGKDVKTIAITSTGTNEGKTTISTHLAASLAELGKQVLLVDTDMRKSVMAGRYTNVTRPRGLSELLSGQCSVADALYEVEGRSMSVVFSGQYPPNPAELLSSSYFDQFLASAREIYDYILLDTAPLGMVVDAAVVASKCDGAVLVIGGEVRYPQAQEVLDMLKKSGCRILGAVMNQVNSKQKSYYNRYGEYKYKYRKYGTKYGQPQPARKKD